MSSALRELYIRLQVEHGDTKTQMRQLMNEVKAIEAEYRKAAQEAGGYANSTDKARASVSEMTEKLAAQKNIVTQTAKSLEEAKASLVGNRDALSKNTEKLEESKRKHADLGTAVKQLEADMDQSKAATGDNTEEYIRMSMELDALQKEHEKAGEEVKKYTATIAASEKGLNSAKNEVAYKMAVDANARAEQTRLEQQLGKTNEKLKHHVYALEDASKKMKDYAAKTRDTAQAQEQAGRALSVAVTAPILSAGGLAVKTAIDWESAYAGVRKTVNGTEQELAALESRLLGMTNIPTDELELADIAANAGQLGVATKNVAGFTRTIADMKETTNLTAEQAAQDMAKFANVTKMPQENFERMASTVVELGNNMATTEADIMSMSMNIASAGTQAGIAQPKIVGIAAGLSSLGLEAQAGGTAISKTIIGMQVAVETGSKDLEDYAEVAGMSADEFARAWREDAAGALTSFISGLSSGSKSAIVMLDEMGITETRMRDALLRASNASELFTGAIDMGTRAWQENTALTREAEVRYGTVESRMQMVGKQARNTARAFGQDLVPYLEDGMATVSGLMEKFGELDEEQRRQIINWAAIAAAMGPGLSLLGKANGMIGNVSAGLGNFTANIAKAGGGVKGVTSAIGGLLGPAGMLALAGVVLYGAYRWYDWASGAQAAREAAEAMMKTAEQWNRTQAKTFYDTGNDPFARFDLSKADFGSGVQKSEDWLASLIQTWTDGKKETGEIVSSFIDGFKGQSDEIRDAIASRKAMLDGLGVEITPDMDTDLKQLDEWDAEIARLLKKRQNGMLTDKEQARLDEVVRMRAELQIEYVGPEKGSYEKILQGVEAEIARLNAVKLKPGSDLYADAMKAAAQGNAAYMDELNAGYSKQYAQIMAISDEAERSEALEKLNAQYAERKAAAAKDYIDAMTSLTPQAMESPEIKQGIDDLAKLTSLTEEYSKAKTDAERGAVVGKMQTLFDGMDEGAITSYMSLLAQIQDLKNQDPNLDPDSVLPGTTAALKDFSVLKEFVGGLTGEAKAQLEGLNALLSEVIPDEVRRVMIELELEGATKQWEDFETNASSITTAVNISDYKAGEKATVEAPKDTVEALIGAYKEAVDAGIAPPSDAVEAYIKEYLANPGTAVAPPEAVEALISAYTAATGARVISPDPEVGAFINRYQATPGARAMAPKPTVDALITLYKEAVDAKVMEPSQPVQALINKYIENPEGVSTSDLLPVIGALVNAYAEHPDGADIGALKPLISALVDNYLDMTDENDRKELEPKINALVQAFGETEKGKGSKDNLLAAMTAYITAYDDSNAVKPSLEIEAQVKYTGNPLSVNMATADLQTPLGPMNLGSSIEQRMRAIVDAAERFKKSLETGESDGLGDPLTASAEEIDIIDSQRGFEKLTTFIGEYTAALEKNTPISEEAQVQMQSLLEFVTALADLDSEPAKEALKEIGANIFGSTESAGDSEAVLSALEKMIEDGKKLAAGVGKGASEYDFSGDMETMAQNAESATQDALDEHSPSERLKPHGGNAAAGVGLGMREYDFTADAEAMAENLSGAVASAMDPVIPTLKKRMLELPLHAQEMIRANGGGFEALIQGIRERSRANADPRVPADSVNTRWVPDIFAAIDRLNAKMSASQAQPMPQEVTYDQRVTSTVNVTVAQAVIRDERSIDELANAIADRQKRLIMGRGGR